jgi:hypothetical protein
MLLQDKAGTTCLDCDPTSKALFMNTCNKTSMNQKWEWGFVNETMLDNWETSGRKLM